MTRVVTSGRWRVAAYHLPLFLTGLAFPSVFFFVVLFDGELPRLLAYASGLFGLIGLYFAFQEGRKIRRILRAPGQWRAEIDATSLRWEAAVPAPHFPLTLPLDKITKLVWLDRITRDNDGQMQTETSYEIHLADGDVIALNQEQAGINPNRVFRALKEHGIAYELWRLDQQSDPHSQTRRFERAL